MDLKSGLADQSVQFAAWTTATGAPVTVTSATAGLSLWYRRGVAGAKTAISPSDLASLETSHTDGGILVIAGAEHRLDLPDDACIPGVLTVSWGGEATGITIDGGVANLIGQANTASDTSHVAGTTQTAGDILGIWTAVKAGYLTGAVALEATLAAIKGATFSGATDSLEALRDRGDAAWLTATGFAVPGSAMALTSDERTALSAAAVDAVLDEAKGSHAGFLTTLALESTAQEVLEDTSTTLPAAIAGVAGSMTPKNIVTQDLNLRSE